MTELAYALVIIAALFIMSLLTRGLPFVFSQFLKNSKALRLVGNDLPGYIMVLLVIFEVGIKQFNHYPYALPALLALALLTVVHLWRRHVLLSMMTGSVVYLLLGHFWFN